MEKGQLPTSGKPRGQIVADISREGPSSGDAEFDSLNLRFHAGLNVAGDKEARTAAPRQYSRDREKTRLRPDRLSGGSCKPHFWKWS